MPTRVKPKKPTNPIPLLGLILTALGFLLCLKLFWGPLKQEARYNLSSLASTPQLPPTPVNTSFSLVIDKIGASAPIVSPVNPYDSGEYQRALTRGIAHAKGTAYPGQGKNIFLFAHSSANPLDASRYNSVFYLMHYLDPGDKISVWYQNQEFIYVVTAKHFVAPTDTQYLTTTNPTETLTLMTCWPPGTTLKRLIVVAKPVLL